MQITFRTFNASSLTLGWPSLLAAMGLLLPCHATDASAQPPSSSAGKTEIRRVIRSARPAPNEDAVESENGSSKLFFEDVAAEALVGERPERSLQSTAVASSDRIGVAEEPSHESDGWSQWISAATIEDEIKREHLNLNRLITTPVTFQTRYGEIGQRFGMLATWFAVIENYQGDVRWSEYAATARELCHQAVVATRKASPASFELCKSVNIEIMELVRGGSIGGGSKTAEPVAWDVVSDRTHIMIRLELANEQIRKWTSNDADFRKYATQMSQESEVTAALAHLIVLPDMPEAEEEDYRDYAMAMQEASIAFGRVLRNEDVESARAAADPIDRSCIDCHAQWR